MSQKIILGVALVMPGTIVAGINLHLTPLLIVAAVMGLAAIIAFIKSIRVK